MDDMQDRYHKTLGDAVAALPPPHRARYLNLTTHTRVRSHGERVRNIFGVNRFRTRIDGGSDFHAVSTESSYTACNLHPPGHEQYVYIYILTLRGT